MTEGQVGLLMTDLSAWLLPDLADTARASKGK
jgi:hypothetical protein